MACPREPVNYSSGLLPLELAEHHGRTLAYSVIAAMNAGTRPIDGSIHASIGDVELMRQQKQTLNGLSGRLSACRPGSMLRPRLLSQVR